MSARKKPRFDLVRSDAGWFARFVGANGRKVWQTEVYRRSVTAWDAVWLIRDASVDHYDNRLELEVRTVDERSKP